MKPIISPNIRIRVPQDFVVGEDSVIDDYCYFSSRIRLGRHCHISNNCSTGGGSKYLFGMEDFCSLAAGVRIWVASGNYIHDYIGFSDVEPPNWHRDEGDVTMGQYSVIGSNTVVMPDNKIPEGVAIGAMSFVPPRFPFEPWSVYKGTPIRLAKRRDKENVLLQVNAMLKGKKEAS